MLTLSAVCHAPDAKKHGVDGDAGKVLVTRPQLLAQSVEQNLAPKIRTLLDVGGVPQVGPHL